MKPQTENATRILIFVAGLLAGAALSSLAHGQPREAVAAAIADLKANVQVQAWPTTRYLTHYNRRSTAKDRGIDGAVLSFVLNSVSRAPTIARPVPISTTMVRIDLAALALPVAAWEGILSDREPYFHITAKLNGKDVIVDGDWVGKEQAAALRNMTGSIGAVARLDWWIVKACQPPHYYTLAGIPNTLAAWHKMLGLDPKRIVELQANKGANLFYSGPTRKVRRLSRWQGPLGASWQTYDSAKASGNKDPIRNPGFKGGAFDASERIAAKANGLHVFAIFDGKGNRADVVPPDIAKDDSDPKGDFNLIPMLSCVRCHIEDGLRPFNPGPFRQIARGLRFSDPVLSNRLAAFYSDKRLEKQLGRDREDYAAAVGKATGGLDVPTTAAGLAKIVREYSYETVTPDSAKAELGAKSLEALKRSSDPILLALPLGIKVQREQWEGSFAEAAILTGEEK